MKISTNSNDVIHIHSFYGLSFQTQDGIKIITFAVMDFDSISSAQQRFQKLMNESELENMKTSIGDSSLEKEYNSNGIWSVVAFTKVNCALKMFNQLS